MRLKYFKDVNQSVVTFFHSTRYLVVQVMRRVSGYRIPCGKIRTDRMTPITENIGVAGGNAYTKTALEKNRTDLL